MEAVRSFISLKTAVGLFVCFLLCHSLLFTKQFSSLIIPVAEATWILEVAGPNIGPKIDCHIFVFFFSVLIVTAVMVQVTNFFLPFSHIDCSVCFTLSFFKWHQLFLFCWGGGETFHVVRRPRIGLLYQPRMVDDECGAVGGMKIGRGNRSIQRKPAAVPLCQCHFVHHNSTSPGLDSNPGRRGGNPATNRLSYGTADTSLAWNMGRHFV
jgi:hypothetical protein